MRWNHNGFEFYLQFQACFGLNAQSKMHFKTKQGVFWNPDLLESQ